jgi:pimeloyl-ACP methyl ester carboxylesterase
MMKTEYLIHLNHKVAYSDVGKGKVIVLLHGYLESKEIWEFFIQKLSKHYRVIAIDLPGHGRTDEFYKKHSMEMMARIVKSVLDRIEIKKCILAGHSMGGYVTLAFAELYPKRLKGFALFNSTSYEDSIEKKADRLRAVELIKNDRLNYISNLINKLFAHENHKKLQEDIERAKAIARHTLKSGAIAALHGMRGRKDRTNVLMDAKCPVFFVYGIKDILIPFEKNVPLSMLPKKHKVSITEASGHMTFIEDAETTLTRFREFVKYCLK